VVSEEAMNGLPNEGAYGAWEGAAKELIELEMALCGIRYQELARLFEKLGVEESPEQINGSVRISVCRAGK
jgi:hypothetical protein